MIKQWDVIVIGSGPGGATVAREAAAAGHKVLLLEQGSAVGTTSNGSMLSAKAMLQRVRFHRLGGMTSLVRGAGKGGTSMLYFASAWAPPLAMFARYGIDLTQDLARAYDHLPHGTLPDAQLGPVAQTALKAAQDLGLPWAKLDKLIDTSTTTAPSHAAKWNASIFTDEASRHGCQLIQGAQAVRVIHRDGTAEMVAYKVGQKMHVAYGDRIVLAAGGLGSAALLRASGIDEAGDGFFCDPIIPVFGYLPGLAARDEYAMAAGLYDAAQGYMVTDMALPPLLYRGFTALAGRWQHLFRHGSCVSLMVKARDEIAGSVNRQGSPRKRLSADDQAKLQAGCQLAHEVLTAAGARSIFTGPTTSAHPGGTVRLGRHLDAQLQTRIKRLHVCDAAVIPEPWGLPPTLTLVTLGMYLWRQLDASNP